MSNEDNYPSDTNPPFVEHEIIDSMVWVRFQKEGIHKYPAALNDPKLTEVSFLGHPHRHIFHFVDSWQIHQNCRHLYPYSPV